MDKMGQALFNGEKPHKRRQSMPWWLSGKLFQRLKKNHTKKCHFKYYEHKERDNKKSIRRRTLKRPLLAGDVICTAMEMPPALCPKTVTLTSEKKKKKKKLLSIHHVM